MISKLMKVGPVRSILEPLMFRRVLKAAEEYEEGNPCRQSDYMQMVRRFCSTDGTSQEQLLQVVQQKRPILEPPEKKYSGVCGDFEADGITEAADALREDGFYRFPNLLHPEICDALTHLALNEKCGRNRPAPPGEPEQMVVDLENPITDTYHLSKSTIMGCPAAQKLIADEVFLAISEGYFGCRPIFSSVSQWWSFPHPKGDQSTSAQMYHFDMDRIKWLKFFVYLTDVTPETGAHYFVRGTHREGGQPKELRKKDYSRISDEEIARHFDDPDILQMSGLKGTVFVEDTRGYHKGNPLKSGHRLVLDVEYACSLFGTPFEKIAVSDPDRGLRTPHVERRYPDLYARCNFEEHRVQ